jgi:hypothetical protein
MGHTRLRPAGDRLGARGSVGRAPDSVGDQLVGPDGGIYIYSTLRCRVCGGYALTRLQEAGCHRTTFWAAVLTIVPSNAGIWILCICAL